MKLYDPAGVAADPRVPTLIVEDDDGKRWLVRNKWEDRQPYAGAVRLDGVASCLRGMAWAMGIPGGRDAECAAF